MTAPPSLSWRLILNIYYQGKVYRTGITTLSHKHIRASQCCHTYNKRIFSRIGLPSTHKPGVQGTKSLAGVWRVPDLFPSHNGPQVRESNDEWMSDLRGHSPFDQSLNGFGITPRPGLCCDSFTQLKHYTHGLKPKAKLEFTIAAESHQVALVTVFEFAGNTKLEYACQMLLLLVILAGEQPFP